MQAQAVQGCYTEASTTVTSPLMDMQTQKSLVVPFMDMQTQKRVVLEDTGLLLNEKDQSLLTKRRQTPKPSSGSPVKWFIADDPESQVRYISIQVESIPHLRTSPEVCPLFSYGIMHKFPSLTPLHSIPLRAPRRSTIGWSTVSSSPRSLRTSPWVLWCTGVIK